MAIRRSESASILSILAIYLFLAVFVLPRDTFFTCDNGMKYIQVVYLVENGFRSDRIPYAGKFIDPAEKYFPIIPPFAYRIGGPTYPQYPLLFAVLSAVPYIIFGFRGLYIIPVFSGVLSSVMLLRLLALLGVTDDRKRSLLVLFYGLGTPIFFYSLLFWEHTLSVLLFLTAVYLICRGIENGGRRWFLAAGLVIGFSIWARFENAVYCLACVVSLLLTGRGRVRRVFTLCLPVAASVLLLFLFNRCYYGMFLGPHVIQVLRARIGAAGHLRLAAGLLFAPVSGLLLMCPFMSIVGAGKILLGRVRSDEKAGVGSMVRFIYFTTVISIATVILTAYNDGGTQWGPRYLLPVLPLGVALLAVACRRGGVVMRSFIVVVVSASISISFLGIGMLYGRKVRDLYPAVSWIKSCGCEYIVFSSTYPVLEMGAAFPEKTYFLARGFGDFLEIAARLRKAGIGEVAACRWEEGSFAELYERHRDHEVVNERERLSLEQEDRCRASRDYTFYRWKTTLEAR